MLINWEGGEKKSGRFFFAEKLRWAKLWPSLQLGRLQKSGRVVSEDSRCCNCFAITYTFLLPFAETLEFLTLRNYIPHSPWRQPRTKSQLTNNRLTWFAGRQTETTDNSNIMADCVTRVELHVSCRGLLDKDTTSKSDPLCAMYIQDAHGKWNEVS